MRLLEKTSFKLMPWKNGGGETIEIMTFPEEANLTGFEWRISMAHVASDGPFSNFPDIDRHLAVLEGNGMTLSVGGAPVCTLNADSPAYAFAGDILTDAVLSNGPIKDLNVMVRRGFWQAALTCHDLKATHSIQMTSTLAVFLVQQGTVHCAANHTRLTALCGDAILMQQQEAPVILEPHGVCRIWQIDLQKVMMS